MWAKRALGLPGAVSFRRLERYADEANRQLGGLHGRPDRWLADSARSTPTGDRSAALDASRLAYVAEAARRSLGFTPFREQLVGACALITNHAVEMDTGEGKTLAGALAAAYGAVSGRRVHVISVNDYLARRDGEWMAALYRTLGISVGWIAQSSTREHRRQAYACEVVYSSVSEIGYDVLRERFRSQPEEPLIPGFDLAIVDEADAVMIDEAMTPLVLAGDGDTTDPDVETAMRIVNGLTEGLDFRIDPDGATVSFTDTGLDAVEAQLGGISLYSGSHTPLLTRLNLALHARALVHRDVDYLVLNGEIKLISTSRGRVSALQRWPDGLHAAVEAKEHLTCSGQGVLMDSITVQDLLSQYKALAGMSGTMLAVSEDLLEFYGLRSGRVGRRRPIARHDAPDVVFASRSEKTAAVIEEILRLHRRGQPVLVGTQSVAESESIAQLLRAADTEPRVLNAKNDECEAREIARAGQLGAITVSTQMSGRGTDIRLGGGGAEEHARVVEAGGLAVVAMGHYPSRRLDAQLRGRSGRQGDPGFSIVFSSLDDDLVRQNMPDFLRTCDRPQRSRLTDRQMRWLASSAQRISEGSRLDRHRTTWAMNRAVAQQRSFVLAHRDAAMTTTSAFDRMLSQEPALVDAVIERFSQPQASSIVRSVVLLHLDTHWAKHLETLQDIRDGIHLRALAGEDPVRSFHLLALAEFDGWLDRVYSSVAGALRARLRGDPGEQDAFKRPSSTWTYMISENPLGDGIHRATRRRHPAAS
jgi:preprotein translocase subunit SecA